MDYDLGMWFIRWITLLRKFYMQLIAIQDYQFLSKYIFRELENWLTKPPWPWNMEHPVKTLPVYVTHIPLSQKHSEKQMWRHGRARPLTAKTEILLLCWSFQSFFKLWTRYNYISTFLPLSKQFPAPHYPWLRRGLLLMERTDWSILKPKVAKSFIRGHSCSLIRHN